MDAGPEEPPTQEFRPEQLSRRGEITAWGLAALTLAAWIFLRFIGQTGLPGIPLLAAFLIFAGASISLGNWMERRTVLRIEPAGVTFDNGLRHTHLAWDQITQIQVWPGSWGKKVRVLGERAYFDFRTLVEMNARGGQRARWGFADGEKIVRELIERANLKRKEQSETGGYTYARE